jgi:hypothetical protein
MNSDPQPVPNDADASAAEPAPEGIARRADAIWEREGRPEGRDGEHWREAEAQLRLTRAHG